MAQGLNFTQTASQVARLVSFTTSVMRLLIYMFLEEVKIAGVRVVRFYECRYMRNKCISLYATEVQLLDDFRGTHQYRVIKAKKLTVIAKSLLKFTATINDNIFDNNSYHLANN